MAIAIAAATVALAAPSAQAAMPRLGTDAIGPALMVSFRHAPDDATAHAALDPLGSVEPVAPEAGVWAVRAPADAGLRGRALRRPGVDAAEWSLARSTDERRIAHQAVRPAPLALTPVAAPSDQYYANGTQWALTSPATTWGIDLTGTPPRPRIAILDSGVDSSHPEWSGPNSPLVRPWSAWTGKESAEDWGKTGHGTHVAGIAAAPVNGIGVVGVAPGAKGTAEVIPVQIADRDGYSTDETMIKGIRWAVRNGAKVINISAGGVGDSAAFQRVVDWAFSSGTLIVASVGNDGQDYGAINYPAGYWNVIGVAAQCSAKTDPVDCPTPYGLATFSTRNASVDIVAPGVDIISSVPPRVHEGEVSPGYAVKEGTSMSAPFVAGVAAEVFAANPGATPFQVLLQLQNTATDMGPTGRDASTGSGLINPRAAITLPLPANDPYEANSDVDEVRLQRAIRPPTSVTAYADVYNDPTDVYPVTLRKGQALRLSGSTNRAKLKLAIWPPGTRSVTRGAPAASTRSGSRSPRLRYTATRSGRWYVSVKATAGRGSYRLSMAG